MKFKNQDIIDLKSHEYYLRCSKHPKFDIINYLNMKEEYLSKIAKYEKYLNMEEIFPLLEDVYITYYEFYEILNKYYKDDYSDIPGYLVKLLKEEIDFVIENKIIND